MSRGVCRLPREQSATDLNEFIKLRRVVCICISKAGDL